MRVLLVTVNTSIFEYSLLKCKEHRYSSSPALTNIITWSCHSVVIQSKQIWSKFSLGQVLYTRDPSTLSGMARCLTDLLGSLFVSSFRAPQNPAQVPPTDPKPSELNLSGIRPIGTNMHNEWKLTSQTLHGIPCLENRLTKELTAFGTTGCIYEIAPGEYAAIRYLPGGDEVLTRAIAAKQLKTWRTRLGIPDSVRDQKKLIPA